MPAVVSGQKSVAPVLPAAPGRAVVAESAAREPDLTPGLSSNLSLDLSLGLSLGLSPDLRLALAARRPFVFRQTAAYQISAMLECRKYKVDAASSARTVKRVAAPHLA